MRTSLLVLLLLFVAHLASRRCAAQLLSTPQQLLDSSACVEELAGQGSRQLLACTFFQSIVLRQGPGPATLPASALWKFANVSTQVAVGGLRPAEGDTFTANPDAASPSPLPPTLDLGSRSALFSVPANGSLELRGLRITGALLPSSPFPLPPSALLSLSAFRMGPGARLRLVDTIITTPSCAALSLQQTFACAASPSPNFTVTPASLHLHRLTTATLDATNVTLLCSGAAAPFPCLAQSVFSGPDLMAAVSNAQAHVSAAAAAFGRSDAALFLHIARSIVLAEGAPQHSDGGAQSCSGAASSTGSSSGSGSSSSNSSGSGSSYVSDGGYCTTAIDFRIVLWGAPALEGPPTILDLAGTTSLFKLERGAGGVELRHLTLRYPPAGAPEGHLAFNLLRLPLWTWVFPRRLLGAAPHQYLLVEDCVLELPPEEVALWLAVAELPLPLPPRLAEWHCVVEDDAFLVGMKAAQVPGADDSLLLVYASGWSQHSAFIRIRLTAAWPSPMSTSTSATASEMAHSTPRTAATPADASKPVFASAIASRLGEQQLTGAQAPTATTITTTTTTTTTAATTTTTTTTPAALLQYPSPPDRAPSLCLLVPPGAEQPFHMWDVRSRFTTILDPGDVDLIAEVRRNESADNLINPRTAYLAMDARLQFSNNRNHYPSFGQVQPRVYGPAMFIGDPLAARVLSLAGLPSAITLAGPGPALLTLRHLTLVAAPAAGPRRSVSLRPAPPPRPNPPPQPPLPSSGSDGDGSSVAGQRRLQRNGGRRSRRLHQEQFGARQSLPAPPLLAPTTASTPGATSPESTRGSSSDSFTQGQPPSLANFTSCLWTFDFDRSPAALAADMAGGGEGGRPAGLPRLFLDSVLLVLPQPELELLSRVWLHAAALRNGSLVFGPDTDAGLAGQLGAMVRDSQLEAAVTQGSSSGSSNGDSSSGGSSIGVAVLAFQRLSWCGVAGRNVTLGTNLPDGARWDATNSNDSQISTTGEQWFPVGQLELSRVAFQQPPTLTPTLGQPSLLPPQQPPPLLPSPTKMVPSEGDDDVKHDSRSPVVVQADDSVSRDGAGVALGSELYEPPRPTQHPPTLPGMQHEATPTSSKTVTGRVLVIVLPCLAGVTIAVLAAVGVWAWRRRLPATARSNPAKPQSKRDGVGRSKDKMPQVLVALGQTLCGAPTRRPNVSSSSSSSCGVSRSGPKRTADVSASARQQDMERRQRSARTALVPTASRAHLGRTNRAVSSMLLAIEDGRQQVAATMSAGRHTAGTGATILQVCHSSGKVSAALERHGSWSAADVSSNSDAAGSCVVSDKAQQHQPPALTISVELGRGAQGVVYRGLWRGLDVAVKSVLFQHGTGVDGEPDPRARRAVEEAAIATSLSHPNIVATYAYQLQPLQTLESTRPNASPKSLPSQPLFLCNSSDASVGASGRGNGYLVSTRGSLGLEAEVWKLTLIQELCHANSLRHCLEEGQLFRSEDGRGGAAARCDSTPAAVAQQGVPLPKPAAAAQPSLTSAAEPASPLQPLSARVGLLLARDVARGMAHLHSRGVVHADLSSSNVLLQSRAGRRSSATGAAAGTAEDSEGAASPRAQQGAGTAELGYVAKVCDFGLSGRLDSEADDTHLSGPARRSSAYSAPELVTHGRASPAGDVYAFAVVLWELALGLPLPSALARPESQALRTWLAEQARVLGNSSRDWQGFVEAEQEQAAETQPDLATPTGAAPIAVASVVASPPVEVSALPPGLLWWPEGTPAGVAALAAECLQPQPSSRPSFEAVLGHVEAMLRDLDRPYPGGVWGVDEQDGYRCRTWRFRMGSLSTFLGLQPKAAGRLP